VNVLVAFLEAYFDESYSDKTPRILAVAGYIFEKRARQEFSLELKALLDRYSLPYFHMVDCGPGNPPFNHLDKPERIEIATQMIALIRRYALFGVGYAINQDDHSSLFPDGFFPEGLTHYGDPYSYCSYTCLTVIQQWINKNRFDGQVGYFFEAGHASAPKFTALMNQVLNDPNLRQGLRYGAHGFVPKICRPVQAADMLAYLHYKDLKDAFSSKRPRRKDFIALIEGYPVETKFADRSHLEFMRDQIKDLFERRPLVTGLWGNWMPFVARWMS
jgi:hypothetical protein